MRKLTTSFGNEIWAFESVSQMEAVVSSDKLETFLSNTSFLGRQFGSTSEYNAALKTVWDEGVLTMQEFVDRLEKAELPKIKDLKTKKVFNASEGEVDFDRLMAGNPNHYVKHVSEKGDGVPEVTIVIDTCGHSGITPSDLLWRGAAGVALAKVLEQQGYRTEIWALAGATIYNEHPERGVVVATNLKNPGDPLDISTLINTVSGWFFRAEIFALFHAIAEKSTDHDHEKHTVQWGLGQHFVPADGELNVITNDQKRVFSSGTFSFNGALGMLMGELRKIAEREE